MIHELKCCPPFFAAIEQDKKTFELRRNDRGFNAGDVFVLREWSPVSGTYTGNRIAVDILYVLSGCLFGLREDYVAMSIKTITNPKRLEGLLP